MTPKPTTAERDSAQLEALGYDSKFDRSMSLWANFALGFTYLSPVVGVYTVFAFAIATGGPPMFWSYLFVGLGQLLVALVFGEIVSQFPIAGGLYPWARRLVGKRWAWMAGWVYLWALCTTIAAVAVGGGAGSDDVGSITTPVRWLRPMESVWSLIARPATWRPASHPAA